MGSTLVDRGPFVLTGHHGDRPRVWCHGALPRDRHFFLRRTGPVTSLVTLVGFAVTAVWIVVHWPVYTFRYVEIPAQPDL